LSGFYKKIDKTFKQIQAEREQKRETIETGEEGTLAEEAGGPEPEIEPERPPAPEPKLEEKPKTKPKPPPVRKPEPSPVLDPNLELATEPPPKSLPKSDAPPEVINLPGPKTEPEVAPEETPTAEPPPEPVAEEAPEPEPQPEPVAEEVPPPAPRPEPAPKAPVEPPLKLESIEDGQEITVEQLDALYRANKTAAHARLTGKTLTVKGLAAKVFIRDNIDVRYIILQGAGKGGVWSARCTFNRESASQFSRLNEGETVSVSGSYDGYSKNILFKDCIIVG
jgi:hypothetical protein